MRDEVLLAVFQAAGLGVPFDDMRSVADQLFIKHHGVPGECLDPTRCPNCQAVIMDMKALSAGPPAGFGPPGLPADIDPRSPEALAWASARHEQAKARMGVP